MKNGVITNIVNSMADILMPYQLTKLEEILVVSFENYDLVRITGDYMKEQDEKENNKLLSSFLSSKRVEGCSDRTIKYYGEIIDKMIKRLDSNIKYVMTDDIRNYLSEYKNNNNCSSVTIDNIRRVISSFFLG